MFTTVLSYLFKNKVTDPLTNAAQPYVEKTISAASSAKSYWFGSAEKPTKSERLIEESRATDKRVREKYHLKPRGTLPPELIDFQQDIQTLINNLEEQIATCTESSFYFMMREKVRIKTVKRDALKELLHANDMGQLRKVAQELKGRPEVIAGFTSRTEKLLDRIEKTGAGRKKRL